LVQVTNYLDSAWVRQSEEPLFHSVASVFGNKHVVHDVTLRQCGSLLRDLHCSLGKECQQWYYSKGFGASSAMLGRERWPTKDNL